MASELLKRYNALGGQSDAVVKPAELMDDDTERAGSNRDRNSSVEQEIQVKWQLPGSNDVTQVKKQLIQLLATLLIEFPEQITMIDRKQREWSFHETDSEEKFVMELQKVAMQLHSLKNKQRQTVRWISVIKFRTTVGIKQWKDNDNFYSSARDMRAYLFPHPFGADNWNIVSIGFLKNIHAIHYPKEELYDQICRLIKETNTRATIPKFQMIPQRITTSDKQASTKAYTIQCTQADAKDLNHLLTQGAFRKEPNQWFVPFRYKKTNPDIFLKCIRKQNETYYKTWVIKVEGLTKEAMEVLQPELVKIQGVHHVVPTKRNKEIGEWKIMVDQAKCSFIHRKLTNSWTQLVDTIPKMILEIAPAAFSTPAISSKKVHEYQDNDSDADSYGSLLTMATEISQMNTEDSNLNELPTEYQFPTYAAAAMGSNTSIDSTQVSSPTTSIYNEWQREKQELEEQIRQQAVQIEQIQADLQEKISRSHDLEDRLTKALDLAHTRDMRHEEMMEKFAVLMKLHTDGQPSAVASNPSTPARPPKAVTSPPSKRPNTNPSPHRDIYAMFRQSTGKHTLSRLGQPPGRINYPPSSISTQQEMDTDDDDPLPPPGVKSSRKIE